MSSTILMSSFYIDFSFTSITCPVKSETKSLAVTTATSIDFNKVSSSSYTRGRMNYSIYSSTKCATVNFVQALAEEWGGLGVRVNCVNPERTKTPMRTKNFGIEPEDTLLKSTECQEKKTAQF